MRGVVPSPLPFLTSLLAAVPWSKAPVLLDFQGTQTTRLLHTYLFHITKTKPSVFSVGSLPSRPQPVLTHPRFSF